MSRFLLFCLLTFVNAETDLSAELEELIRDSAVPSIATAAVYEGEIVSAGAFGVRKVGSPEKVTLQDKYHIGSCTKSMTALLAAILVDEGKVTWDRTVKQAFPRVKIHEEYQPATLSQLLTNTGGTPHDIKGQLWTDLRNAGGRLPRQRDILVSGILQKAPVYSPGTGQVYSNAGFSIAGSMLEHAARTPYETLLREKIFLPLGMNSAGFRAPATNGKVDQPYGHHRKFGKLLPVKPEPMGDNPRGIAPATSVHCSVLDMARYALFYLGEHEESLIPPGSFKKLLTPAENTDYAMGWRVMERPLGGACYTHYGTNLMFYCRIWIAPGRRFAAIAMCNTGEAAGEEKCNEAVELLIRKHLD